MMSKFFENNVTQKCIPDEYVIFVVPTGFMAVPTFIRTDKKIKISCEELRKKVEEDIFIIDSGKVLEMVLDELNKLILKETGSRRRILLSFEKDFLQALEEEFSDLVVQNKLIHDQFDSE